MVITNTGLNNLASNFAAVITTGQWGNGTAEPSVNDTGLTSPLSSTLMTLTTTYSGNTAQFNHVLGSTVANGETLREFELRYNDTSNFMKTLGGDVNKLASMIVTTIVTVGFVRQ